MGAKLGVVRYILMTVRKPNCFSSEKIEISCGSGRLAAGLEIG